MRKPEKSLIFINQNVTNKIKYYSGILYCFAVIYIIFKYYGAFIDYAFTPPPATSLFDYFQSQPTFWKAIINRFLFERPRPKNDVWMLGWSEKTYFWNMGDLSDRKKSFGFYDKQHFMMTWARMLDTFQGALSGPDNVFLYMKKRDPYYQKWCYKIYQYSRENIWEWWPVVESDEFELKLRYKWYHNFLDLPLYYFLYYCIDPVEDVVFGWPYRYFLDINFKEDFVDVVRNANQYSIILCPIIEFIIKIKGFIDYFYTGSFIYGIFYFIDEYLLSKTIWGFHFYYWIRLGFVGRGWDIFFYCTSVENILYFADCFRLYILNILSYISLKLFALFGFNLYLNSGFVFINKLLFILFSRFILIFLFITIFNRRFWINSIWFLKYLFFIWDNFISVFISAVSIKIFKIPFYLLAYLWKFLLKKCLHEKTIIRIYVYLRKNYNKFLWYKFFIFHICMQEILVEKPYFKSFSDYCHEYRGPVGWLLLAMIFFHIMHFLFIKLLGF